MNKIDPNSLEPLYNKKIECPLCNNSFTSKKVRSRFVKPLQTDTDFGPLFSPGDGNNPLLYYVVICPKCGYSFTEEFNCTISSSAKKIILEEISQKLCRSIDYSGVRDIPAAIATYKLAIYCGQLIKEKHLSLARLCLRLAWLYRSTGERIEEIRFLQSALSEFEQAYIKSQFDPDHTPEIYILYMIGELNRRVGNFNEAVKFFSAVIEHPQKYLYSKYANLARKQWRLTAEEYGECRKQNTSE